MQLVCKVFGDPRVQRSLADVLLLRADVTANDPRHQALMRTHQVIGPPTVMLFDATGHERRGARLVGEFTVEQLLQRRATGPTQGAPEHSALPPSLIFTGDGRLRSALGRS